MHRGLTAAAFLFSIIALAQQPSNYPGPPPADAAADLDTAPLPDIQTLLAHVRGRYDALESLRKNYICTVTQVADEFSGNGSKKTHTDEYQAFYVGNTEVLQHISRDHKPLSPGDAAKEQQRVDKLVTKLKSGENKSTKDQIRLSSMLRLATFANPRREFVRGRPTLVFDYKGDPHAKTDSLGDEIMARLEGSLWIDERDAAIVRFTGTLEENFHVAGGLLVNIKKGSWLEFRQSPVNEEIWLPAELIAHVDGKFLLVKGFNGDMHETFSDYRKMKTSVTILPGTQVIEDTAPASPPPANPEATPSGSPPTSGAPKP